MRVPNEGGSTPRNVLQLSASFVSNLSELIVPVFSTPVFIPTTVIIHFTRRHALSFLIIQSKDVYQSPNKSLSLLQRDGASSGFFSALAIPRFTSVSVRRIWQTLPLQRTRLFQQCFASRSDFRFSLTFLLFIGHLLTMYVVQQVSCSCQPPRVILQKKYLIDCLPLIGSIHTLEYPKQCPH